MDIRIAYAAASVVLLGVVAVYAGVICAAIVGTI